MAKGCCKCPGSFILKKGGGNRNLETHFVLFLFHIKKLWGDRENEERERNSKQAKMISFHLNFHTKKNNLNRIL